MDFFLISSNDLANDLNSVAQSALKSIGLNQSIDGPNNSKIIHSWLGHSKFKIYKNERFEIYFCGYLKCRSSNDLKTAIFDKAYCICEFNQNSENSESGIYNLIIRDNYRKIITFANDPSGLFPLFFTIKQGCLYVGSHAHLMAQILNLAPDALGIIQKMTYGYTIGSRTYYEHLSSLNPAEIIEYSIQSGKIKISHSQSYFTGEYEILNKPDELLFEALLNSFQAHREKYENFGLMLSEGFDSRLMGGFANKTGFNIYTFTHGTPRTKGSLITELVANSLDAHYHFDDLPNGFPSDHLELKKQLLMADNLNIAYWNKGAEYFSNLGRPVVVSAGTALDSTLGGHVFYKPSKPRLEAVLQRYNEIFHQNINRINNKYIEDLSEVLLSNRLTLDFKNIEKKIQNSFSKEISHWLIPNLSYLIDSVQDEFSRLKNSGSVVASQILQRFFLEQRVRKFSFGQELTLKMYNHLIVPSYEYSFMSLASVIYPKEKMHHKFYLQFLKKYFPELAKIKNGGYGLPATYPRMILESARFLLKYFDNRQMKSLLMKKGKYDPSNFRGVLISEYTVRNNKCLDDLDLIINSNSEILNSKIISSQIHAIQEYKRRAFNLNPIYDGIEYCQIFQKKLNINNCFENSSSH